jgi:ATP-binding cassette subfamily G (WHITE) protein 2 (PDR)
MYHPGIDAISSLITIWPVKLISVSLFNCSLYFMANLKREPAAFFIFLLFTFTVVLMMSSMFRFVAAINKHEATATSIAGILVLPLIIYTGCRLSSAPCINLEICLLITHKTLSLGRRCIPGLSGYRT